jgi:hypothetical protein
MTFTLMLILNIVLDIGILAALAFVMTRPAKLTPHGERLLGRPARRHAARDRAGARGQRVPSTAARTA